MLKPWDATKGNCSLVDPFGQTGRSLIMLGQHLLPCYTCALYLNDNGGQNVISLGLWLYVDQHVIR